jgi:hypothetical protein
MAATRTEMCDLMKQARHVTKVSLRSIVDREAGFLAASSGWIG